MPSENKLSASYGLSVGTVRKAVEQLVGEGLLERRRGAGTYVRQPAFSPNLFRFFHLHDVQDERQSIPESRLLARAVVSAPPLAAAALGTDRVIRLDRLRLLGGQPLLAEEIFVPLALFDGLQEMPEPLFGPLLYPLYQERFGVIVTTATDEVTLGLADEKRARLLAIRSGEPVAIIERLARDPQRQPIEWRRAYGRGDRFRYRVEIA